MSEITGPQTGNSYSKLRPGTIGRDLEGFHSRLDKGAPGVAEVRKGGTLIVLVIRTIFGSLNCLCKYCKGCDSQCKTALVWT